MATVAALDEVDGWPLKPRSALAIVSLFRDRAGLVPRYRAQVEALRAAWDGPVDIVCVEGDSKDATPSALSEWASADSHLHVVTLNHGRPYYGSMVHPERFLILSMVANAGLDYIVSKQLAPDYVLFMESDVYYQPDLACRLREAMEKAPEGTGVVAPMVWFDGGRPPFFYDTWAFRATVEAGGAAFPPHSEDWFWQNCPHEPYAIGSAGTVLFCKAEPILAGARFTVDDVIVGFCRECTARGAAIAVDPTTHVRHPSHEEHHDGRW